MMQELRCQNPGCRKVLMHADIRLGVIIKVCPKCKKRNIYKFPKPANQETT